MAQWSDPFSCVHLCHMFDRLRWLLDFLGSQQVVASSTIIPRIKVPLAVKVYMIFCFVSKNSSMLNYISRQTKSTIIQDVFGVTTTYHVKQSQQIIQDMYLGSQVASSTISTLKCH